MDFNLVTLLVSLGMAAGVLFTVLPVLPGSLIALISLIVWAFAENNPVGWTVFAFGAVLLVAAGLMQYILTGRAMKKHAIPSASVIAGVITGLVGMFVIPVVGLPLGFALGLFGMELVRQKDLKLAGHSSLQALKATGMGMLAELGLTSLAATIFFTSLLLSSQV